MYRGSPHTLPLLVVLFAALLVQSVSFSSYFRHDDWLHLYGAVDPGLGEYAFQPHGGHVFPMAKVIFGVFDQVFGLNPLPFVILQSLLHCLNAALLYGLSFRVTNQRFLACFAALLWGTAPIHVVAIGWFTCVQILMCLTCMLAILYDLAGYVRANRVPSRRSLAYWYLLAILGVCSWGAGIIIPLSLPIIAFLLLPKEGNRVRTAVCLMPLVLVPFAYHVYISSFAMAKGVTSVSLVKAVQLDAMLVSYGFAAFACPPVFTISEAGTLIWTDSGPSPPAFVALTLVASIPCLAIALIGYFRGGTSVRRWILTMVLLSLGSYGLIAVGRSASSPRTVYELATVARYHYLSGACIVLVVAIAMSTLSRRLPKPFSPRSRSLGIGFLLLFVAMAIWGAKHVRRDELDNATQRQVASYEQYLRRIVAAAPPGNDVYIRNDRFRPASLLRAMGVKIDRFPNLAGYYAITHSTNTLDGRRIYFVESDRGFLRRIRTRKDSRMSQLLVSPAEVSDDRVAVFNAKRERRIQRKLR